jgi:hypothetical protein
MPFYEFKKADLYYNRLKTFPHKTFVVYDSKIYIDNSKNSKATFNNELSTKQGFISLYELNVDRTIDIGTPGDPSTAKSIYPFVTKQGSRISFKTGSVADFNNSGKNSFGDIIVGGYPLSSSIKTTRLAASTSDITTIDEDNGQYKKYVSNKKFILSLKNTFNKYVNISHHYAYDSGSTSEQYSNKSISWNKGQQEMRLVEIPSIFYGSSIRKGSVILRLYISGTLAAEARDTHKNGELIQVSGSNGSDQFNNQVAGVVLYNEGFLAMTGAWALNKGHKESYNGTADNPRWFHFGKGANDGSASGAITGSLFSIEFEGVNYVPTVTMLAHAPKSALNHSSNPTYVSKDNRGTLQTSSYHFRENVGAQIANLEHQSYSQYGTSSFVKQTYISKIGIYDENKNLIGIASLAKPIRKTEEREYTFKLKMDF